MRRVITGHNAAGRSVIARDDGVDAQAVPGMETVALATIWGAEEPMTYPHDGSMPPHHDFFPPLPGARFIAFALAPDADQQADDDADASAARTEQLFPGLLAHFTVDDPGMHRTATTDLLYVAAGRCVLELDDGSRTTLSAGDSLVQSGTMHRWHNPFDETCHIVGVTLGAQSVPQS